MLRTMHTSHNNNKPIQLFVVQSAMLSAYPSPYITHTTNYPYAASEAIQYQYRQLNQHQKRQMIHAIAIGAMDLNARYVTIQHQVTRNPNWQYDNPFIDNVEFYPNAITVANDQYLYVKRHWHHQSPKQAISDDLPTDLTLDSLISHQFTEYEFAPIHTCSEMDAGDYMEYFGDNMAMEDEMQSEAMEYESYMVPASMPHGKNKDLWMYDAAADLLSDDYQYITYLKIRYEHYEYTKPQETNHNNKAKMHTKNSASPIITPPPANPKRLYTILLLIFILLLAMICLCQNITMGNRTEPYQSTKHPNCTEKEAMNLIHKPHHIHNTTSIPMTATFMLCMEWNQTYAEQQALPKQPLFLSIPQSPDKQSRLNQDELHQFISYLWYYHNTQQCNVVIINHDLRSRMSNPPLIFNRRRAFLHDYLYLQQKLQIGITKHMTQVFGSYDTCKQAYEEQKPPPKQPLLAKITLPPDKAHQNPKKDPLH
eukprot:192118_1